MNLNRIEALSFAAAIVLIGSVAKAEDCPVVFQEKVFTDGGSFISVHGALTGEGVPYKYNNQQIDCVEQKQECLVTVADSIGSVGGTSGVCQVAVDMPMPLEVVQWAADRIIATYDNQCGSTEYIIDRRAESVDIRQRDKPEKPECVARGKKIGPPLDPTTYHWTIENPPFWKDWKTLGPAKALENLSDPKSR